MAGDGRPAPLVSVVLPTYNEAGSIGVVLGRLDAAFLAADSTWEAVVVDDDSPDGTADVAREAGLGSSGAVQVVVRTGERGLGTAVVRGLQEATGRYVCVMDADGQHPVSAVVAMVDEVEHRGVDVVIGSRHRAGGSTGSFARHRRFVSWAAATAARLALPAVRRNRLTDPMSGLFLVRRACLDGVTLRPRGYKVLLDVLVRARPVGRRLRVSEVGYVFGAREAGESKLDAGVAAEFLAHLAVVAARDRGNRRLALGALVGMVLVLIGVIVWRAVVT